MHLNVTVEISFATIERIYHSLWGRGLAGVKPPPLRITHWRRISSGNEHEGNTCKKIVEIHFSDCVEELSRAQAAAHLIYDDGRMTALRK